MSRRRRYLLLVLALLFSNRLIAQTTPVTQSEVKAIFLYNFVNFTEWPPEVFHSKNDTIVIGVLGENPFGTSLEEAVQNEKKDGHPLKVRYFADINEIEKCHILFISTGKTDPLRKILTALQGKHVLTAGDELNFTEAGGMVRFYIEENKIRLEVNMEAVKKEGLEISSRLLMLAKIVNPPAE